MALIQKLQKGKTIQGGANRGLGIDTFDKFVGTVLDGGPDSPKVPYAFTNRSEKAIRDSWGDYKALEQELAKHNLTVSNVYKYDPVTKKHTVDTKALEGVNLDPTIAEKLGISAKVEQIEPIVGVGDLSEGQEAKSVDKGVKIYWTGLRSTRNGLAAILDLKVAYDNLKAQPKTGEVPANYISIINNSLKNVPSKLSEGMPKDPYEDLKINQTNYAGLTPEMKKQQMFERGKPRIQLFLNSVKESKNPDVLALKAFYDTNPEFTPENWNKFEKIARNLNWTVHFDTPVSDGSGSSEVTYTTPQSLFNWGREKGLTIKQTGENEYSVDGATEGAVFMDYPDYYGKFLHQTPEGKWTISDEGLSPAQKNQFIVNRRNSENLFNQTDKVYVRPEGYRKVTDGSKTFDKYIDFTGNTDLPDGSELIIFGQEFDQFGGTSKLKGIVKEGGKYYQVTYYYNRNKGQFESNATSVPDSVKKFSILKTPRITTKTYKGFIEFDPDTKVNFTLGRNLSLVPSMKLIQYDKFENQLNRDLNVKNGILKKQVLLKYLKSLQPLKTNINQNGWNKEKTFKSIKLIEQMLKKLETPVQSAQLGGVVLSNKEEEKPAQSMKPAEPVEKTPRGDKSLAEMSDTDKALLGTEVGLMGASMFGGPAGLIAGGALTLLEAGRDIHSGESAGKIATNVAINLGFMALAVIPGMGALRAAKGAGKVLSSTKRASDIAKAAKVAKTLDASADLAKVDDALKIANTALTKASKAAKKVNTASKTVKADKALEEVLELEKLKSGLIESSKTVKPINEFIEQGTKNLDDAISILKTNKNVPNKAIKELEKAKTLMTPGFVDKTNKALDIVASSKGLITLSHATRGALVVDGLYNSIPALTNIYEGVTDKSLSAEHTITEKDILATMRLAGALKGGYQMGKAGLVRAGTTSKGSAYVKADAKVNTDATTKIGKATQALSNTKNTVVTGTKNAVGGLKHKVGNSISGNRALRDISPEDGWFKTMARSVAQKQGYTRAGFDPTQSSLLNKQGRTVLGDDDEALMKAVYTILNK